MSSNKKKQLAEDMHADEDFSDEDDSSSDEAEEINEVRNSRVSKQKLDIENDFRIFRKFKSILKEEIPLLVTLMASSSCCVSCS